MGIATEKSFRISYSISSQKQGRFSILVLNLHWTYFLSPTFLNYIPGDTLLLFQDSLDFPGRTKEEPPVFPLLGFYIYPEDTVWLPLISHPTPQMRQLWVAGNDEIVDLSFGIILWSPLLIIRIPGKTSHSCLFFFILHPLFKTLLFPFGLSSLGPLITLLAL